MTLIELAVLIVIAGGGGAIVGLLLGWALSHPLLLSAGVGSVGALVVGALVLVMQLVANIFATSSSGPRLPRARLPNVFATGLTGIDFAVPDGQVRR